MNLFRDTQLQHKQYVKAHHGYSKCGAHLTMYKVHPEDNSCYTCPYCQVLWAIEDLEVEYPNSGQSELQELRNEVLTRINKLYPEVYEEYLSLGDKEFIKKHRP